MLATRGAWCTSALAAAVLGASSFLGGCASGPQGCSLPAPTVLSIEVLDDGAAVTLDLAPERALAAARAVCRDRTDVLFRLEWSEPERTTVRLVAPGQQELALALVKRIAEEAERR